MLELNVTERIQQQPAKKNWAIYNSDMAALFSERNTHPVDSPEREAMAEKILALWVSEG